MSKPLRTALIVALAILVLFGVASFFVDRAILERTYARVPAVRSQLLATYDDFADRYPRKAADFELDGKTLRGYVYGADNARGLIVFRHGIFSKHEDYLPLIVAMVDKGWRIFAYDAIGCGNSDGDNVIGLSQSPLDVAVAVDYVRESGMADGMEIALWGHSWGGYGVAGALDLQTDIDACVTMSGFDTPMKVLESSAQGFMGPFAFTQTPTLWLNTYLVFGNDADRSASKAILDSGTPTLVIHGTDDTTVPFETVSILDSLQTNQGDTSNVSFKVIETPGRSGHSTYFYSPESQTYLGECSEGLQKLLDENGDDTEAPEVKAYLASIDKLKANTADPTLIDEIDAFLSANLENR